MGWLAIATLFVSESCFAQQAALVFSEGQEALAKGDLETAEKDFRSVLQAEPQSIAARANLGVVYMRRRLWERALAEFRIAERSAPGNPGIAVNIGLAYFHQANYLAAIPEFETVLRQNASSEQARYLLGLCYFGTEAYLKAIDTLQPLWDAESGKMPYLYVLAMTANKAGRTDIEQRALDRM